MKMVILAQVVAPKVSLLGLFIQVQADVVSTPKGKLCLFNLDIFSSLLPVLAGLLKSKTERNAIVALEMLLYFIKIF